MCAALDPVNSILPHSVDERIENHDGFLYIYICGIIKNTRLDPGTHESPE